MMIVPLDENHDRIVHPNGFGWGVYCNVMHELVPSRDYCFCDLFVEYERLMGRDPKPA